MFTIAMAIFAIAPALAQTSDDAIDPVHVFNEACYTKVPDVDSIEAMANRFAWEPIGDKALKKFSPIDSPDLLKGWDMKLANRIFRVGVVQSTPVAGLMDQYPDFKEGTSTSCTLILDGQDDAELTLAQMDILIGKAAASREVPNEGLKTTTWQGGNSDLKVFVVYQSDNTGSANFINVTVLSK
ncbi:MAG: hypothetical protein KTR35_05470 [Gammaproteobacteria bacterium]|nr:hypothetical protein [Gammaproteobacteria bacterium]